MGNRASRSSPAYKSATVDSRDTTQPLTKVTTAGMKALSGPDRELFELAKAGDHEAIRARINNKQYHRQDGKGLQNSRPDNGSSKPAIMTLSVKDQEMKTMLHHAATAG